MSVEEEAQKSSGDQSGIRQSKESESRQGRETSEIRTSEAKSESEDPRSWVDEGTELAPSGSAEKPASADLSAATQLQSQAPRKPPAQAQAQGMGLKLGGTQMLSTPQTSHEKSAMVAHTELGVPASGAASGAASRAASETPSINAPTFVPGSYDEVISDSEAPPPRKGSANAGAMVNAPTSPMVPGQVQSHIGQYEIIRKLGEGGMGVVYLARDGRLGRRVAIKVLRTQDKELTRRFLIEARTTARCTHENIVIIHDAGEHAGSPFMVLEFLEGKTLSDYQATDPPSIPHAVEIMVSVVRALVRAHEEGIVHRDLKPDNIFVTNSGTVKVLDFGIAKLLKKRIDLAATQSIMNPAAAASLMAAVPGATAGVGATGIAGTAGYMSPEQWHSPGDVDHRSDIWAVGCVLFELLTNQNPLEIHETPARVSAFLSTDEPMPTALSFGAKIPEQLSEIIGKCLEKEPSGRYKDARSLLKALEPFLPGRRQALDGPVELGPFAGLRAFQEEDASRFFGRSRELGTLLSRLRETPLMATVGPSGVGKSSFLRAGVIPALKNSGTDWEVLVVRPGRTPMQSLAEHLRPYVASYASERGGSMPPSASDEQITQRLIDEPGFLGSVLRNRCREKGQKLMLFLDQFEELYTLGASQEERRSFTRALLGAADDAVSPVRVMLSIRADFLGRTTEDPEFVSNLSKGLFFLGPPSEEGLREALVRPTEMMGYRFESSVIVDEMVTFLDGTPNGLPLLQFTAAQLWEARDPQNKLLTVSSYRGMGGVEGALVSHADSVYNQLSPEQQILCRTLFMHLVTNERTRAIRTMVELADFASDPVALKQLVDQLVESRLWVVTAQDGATTVEVVHESLIATWPSLRRWLDESHEDSVFVDQLMAAANQWKQKNRDVGLLWRGEMVAELDHFKRHYKGALPPLVAEFSTAVDAQDLKSVRTKRAFMAGGFTILAGLLFAALGGLYIVSEERNKASQNATIAEQRLEEQVLAEKERRLAEEQRSRALVEQKKAEEKTDILEDTVKLNAEELAEKNVALLDALASAKEQEKTAVKAMKRAVSSKKDATDAMKRAEETSTKLQVLLDKERARAQRLDAQIGTLVEDL